MEKELLKLIEEFIKEADAWNEHKKLPNSEFVFEDDIRFLRFRNK